MGCCCCCCCCDDDFKCRPLAFLISLPFALVALVISLIGVVVYLIGLAMAYICPCCMCATVVMEFASWLMKAPILVIKWFTSKIPW